MITKKQKCIACIMAHADDLECFAGGTFARYISEGYKGIYGVLSLCNSGLYFDKNGKSSYQPSAKVIPVRHKEAVNAAKVFGAELFKMDLMEDNFTNSKGVRIPLTFPTKNYKGDEAPKGGIPMVCAASGSKTRAGGEVIERVAKILVENQPDIVIGQKIDDSNPDHFNAALILRKAYVSALEKVKLGPLYVPQDKKSFYPVEPDWIVDVTGHEETAEKAMGCHVCQNGSSRIRKMRMRWQEWGERIHVKSAEPFLRIL